jgi:hypothetical protein
METKKESIEKCYLARFTKTLSNEKKIFKDSIKRKAALRF